MGRALGLVPGDIVKKAPGLGAGVGREEKTFRARAGLMNSMPFGTPSTKAVVERTPAWRQEPARTVACVQPLATGQPVRGSMMWP